MGSCGSKKDREEKELVEPKSPDSIKATTTVNTQVAPVKKFCGTQGFDTHQCVNGTAVFFADFDQTIAKAHTFKVHTMMDMFFSKSLIFFFVTKYHNCKTLCLQTVLISFVCFFVKILVYLCLIM